MLSSAAEQMPLAAYSFSSALYHLRGRGGRTWFRNMTAGRCLSFYRFSLFARTLLYVEQITGAMETSRIHIDRAIGGDRHYRHSGGTAPARRAAGARGGPPDA